MPERSTATKGTAVTPRTTRPFADLLAGIDRGRVEGEIDDKLRELAEAVHDTRKAGTLTVKLKIGPRKGDDGTVEVAATSTITKPQPDHNAVFFVGPSYGLSRDDPTMDAMITRDEALGEH